MNVLFRAVLAFLVLKLSILVVNIVRFPVLKNAPATSTNRPARTVSLLVPMRNEANRLAGTLPGIIAQPVDELILLDDCSTDGTLELAQSLVTDRPHCRTVAGSSTPTGWTGKTWACSQLANHATSDVLIFCDADVLLAPAAISAVLAELTRQQADLLSVFPQQLTASLGEHLIVALVDDVLLSFLPFPLLEADVPAAATANGSLLAIDRLTYDVIGGFESVRGQVIEDVALARLVRRSGLRLGLVLGGDVVRTRMYSSYRDCVTGFGRGLLSVTGGSRSTLLLAALWHLVVYTLPALLCWRRPRWAVALLLAVGRAADRRGQDRTSPVVAGRAVPTEPGGRTAGVRPGDAPDPAVAGPDVHARHPDDAGVQPTGRRVNPPSPTAQRLVGHLGRWGADPLTLLAEGAELGPVFSLRLWRRAVVGYSPAWNRRVLGDLVNFRSRGSMSGLSPYLHGGLVQTDAPDSPGAAADHEPAVPPNLAGRPRAEDRGDHPRAAAAGIVRRNDLVE